MEPDERKVRKRKRWLIGGGLVLVLVLVLTGVRFNWFSSKGDDMLHVVEFSEDGGGGDEAHLNVTLTLSNPTKTPLLTARKSIDVRFYDLGGNGVMDGRVEFEEGVLRTKDIFVIKPGERRKIKVASYRIKRFKNGMGFFQVFWNRVDTYGHHEKEFEELRIEKKGTYDVGSHQTGMLFYQLD